MFTLKWTPAAAAEYEELRRNAQTALAVRGKKGKAKSPKAEGLFKQVHNMLVLLGDNPQQPGLVTHEYQSIDNPFDPSRRNPNHSKKALIPGPSPKGRRELTGNQKVFKAYLQNKTAGAYCIFWCYGPGKKEITILAITPHP